jgi:hypothetical protein
MVEDTGLKIMASRPGLVTEFHKNLITGLNLDRKGRQTCG